MIFSTNPFLLFFVAVTLLYWLVSRRASHRNLLLFAVSLFFYGWWDWRFVGLLLVTGGLDYYVAQRIEDSIDDRGRRRWLWISLASNLGALGFFKYAGFFIDSASVLLTKMGISWSRPMLEIVLPAGISFYTFQALGYAIDVYRKQIRAERDPIRYFAFLTFFPQLVAGPIERASFLMTQFVEPRRVSQALVQQGVWLMAWGFFMKVVIADYLAPLVDLAFGSVAPWRMGVIAGTLAFGGQIYCDFAGYSTIARGVANTMGFELSPNFAQPYLSSSIQEFWRRWHQTLSTWFRDYVYIPLGGDRAGDTRTFFNVVATFTLAGLWHGASWTFVLWGLWHGLALGFYRLWQRFRPAGWKIRIPGLGWLVTMAVVALGWLFFRARSLDQALAMLRGLGVPDGPAWGGSLVTAVAWGLAGVAVVDVFQRRCPWSRVKDWSPMVRGAIQGVLLVLIISRWGKTASSFIYFQF